MPPKYLESNFNSMVPALSQGLRRDNTDDFVSLMNDVVSNYDFTKVDTDAATNMVSMAAKKMSQQGFQHAEKALKKSLDWIANIVEGGTAATGQLYLTAATVLSKQALDWAEGRFNTYMGWDQEDVLLRGDWVAIDYGVSSSNIMDVDRRRRLPSQVEENALIHASPIISGRMSAKSRKDAERYLTAHESQYQRYSEVAKPLRTKIHAGLASGRKMESTSGTFYECLDLQTGQETYLARQKVLKLPPGSQRKLDADPRLAQVKALYQNPNVHMPDQINLKVSSRLGDNVLFAGDLYTIEDITGKKVRIYDGQGMRVDVGWDDPRLKPAQNSTSYKPVPLAIESNFVTLGGYNRGEYVWVQGDYDDFYLNCISSIKGDMLETYDALSGRSGQANVSITRPVHSDWPDTGLWGQFKDAATRRDKQKAFQYAPGKQYPNDCRAREDETHKFGNPITSSYANPFGSPSESMVNYNQVDTAWNSKVSDGYEDTQEKYSGFQFGGGQVREEEVASPGDYSNLVILLAAACCAYAITR